MLRRNWIWAGVGAAIIGIVFFYTGGTRTKARPFREQPVVNLVVDTDTGERKTIPMETYIEGVVAGEMGQLPAEADSEQDWPHAAYAAQAILARSFAMTFLGDDGVIDISTDVTEAQAYAPENITDAIQKAVESTRGEVMMHDGEYVKAWFHSYSGGKTASAKEGLNHQWEPAFIKVVELSQNSAVPESHKSWRVEIPVDTLSASLKEAGVNVGTVENVRIVEKGPSGRATLVEVTGDGGSERMHGAEFRLAADPEKLKSMLLDELKVEGGQLIAKGSGFGHGVGLSQWDAYELALDGKNAEQIMETFFKDVNFQRLWK